MATRAIVTSHPVVACDVCGRRLLRGESPDVFLAGGQRRTVCELCIPRAAAEGWLREADDHALSVRPARSRRAGSLLGRLRHLREPAQRPLRRETRPLAGRGEDGSFPEGELYDPLDDGSLERSGSSREPELYIGPVEAAEPADAAWGTESHSKGEGEQPAAGELAFDRPSLAPSARAARGAFTSGELKLARALEVFNAGEQPRRVAGVARSLGAPFVSVRPLEESGSIVAIVVAWELCWYRYEVDLGDEAAGVQLIAQGMELEELPVEDRLANATADERGELAALLD
jgi:hypothetical protein